MNKFKALHIVNRRAKYHKNQDMKKNQIRKDALYDLKHRCINQWTDEFERIEKHMINGCIYYCFFYSEWSYHIPEDMLISEEYNDLDVDRIKNFERNKYNDLKCTEKNALNYLYDNHNINANNFISSKPDINYSWYYLP